MSPPLIFIGIIICCIVGAVFSACETAVVACSRVRLHQLAKKGNQRAVQLLALQGRMGQLIGSILIANMFVLTFISSLATEFSLYTFGPVGIVYATVAVSCITAIYVEVAPKMYVYQFPEKVGLALVPLLAVLRSVLYPFTMAVEKIASGTLKLFGISPPVSQKAQEDGGRDELIGAIDFYKNGQTGFHERAMLRGILDLSCVTVSEIMVHRNDIFSLDGDLAKSVICQKISQSPFTRVPIWYDRPDNIRGVINTIRFSRALHGVDGDVDALDWVSLIQEPWFVSAGTNLLDQLQAFRCKRRHMAFVVNEYGDLVGMITLEDILEEIVGEILDEHNVDIPGVRLTGNGTYMIRGDVNLRDLNRQYQWNLSSRGISTLGGAILNYTRSIPKAGQIFLIHGFKMTIVRCHGNRILLVQVEPPKKSS